MSRLFSFTLFQVNLLRADGIMARDSWASRPIYRSTIAGCILGWDRPRHWTLRFDGRSGKSRELAEACRESSPTNLPGGAVCGCQRRFLSPNDYTLASALRHDTSRHAGTSKW